MIVPYYNSILLPYSKNSVELNQHQLEVMKEYLQELFVSNSQQRSIELRVCCLDVPIRESLGLQMKRIIVGLLSGMQQIVWQINGRYSARQQTKLIYKALNGIEIKGSISDKQPVQLQNLQLLKDYYREYKSETEMKQFLKNLLIEEISLEKKTIRYRKGQQVEMLLRVMTAQITGEIEVTYNHKQISAQHSDKRIVWVLMVSREEFKNTRLNQLLRKVEKHHTIDKQVNQIITQHMTIREIQFQYETMLKQMVLRYFSIKSKQFKSAVKQVKDFLYLLTNVKIVKQYAQKLLEEQQSLNRQFLKFVEEMRVKNNRVVEQYMKGWRQQQQFIVKLQHYKNYIKSSQVIKKYMATVKQMKQFTLHKKMKKDNDSRMIQNRIRSFLIVKTEQQHILSSYLQRKNAELTAQNKLYQQIRQLYNHYQVQKLTNCNKYKYGFACVTQILAISNHSCHSGFAAEHLLEFIERANKNHQLLVKLKCEQSYLQATTIEGKTYSIGSRKSTSPVSGSCSNKQNLSHFNISSNTSAKSSNFNSRTKETSAFNRMSMAQSKQTSKWNSIQTDRKGSINIQKQAVNLEMKLDQSGRLLGCGDNSFGQLGLGQTQYISKFTSILPAHKVKLFTTMYHHTVIVTVDNKVFYCGKSKGKLPQSKLPQQIVLKDKIVIKQIVCSLNDTYFLTDRNKIYCLGLMNFILIPKPIELQMEHFDLVRIGTYNLQIVYLVGYWTNTLDRVQKQQISKYLTSNNEMQCSESLLVDDLSLCNTDINGNNIGDLSAILQSPLQ